MVLTRALVQWFRQSRQPTLSSSSEPSGNAAADNHESRLYMQSPAFSPSFPSILSSLLQSQTGSHSSITDHHAVTSPSDSPLNDVVTHPSPPIVSPSPFSPAQLSALLSHLPLMPPSRHAMPDAAPAAAMSSDESVYGTDMSVHSSRVDPGAAADWQMLAAERRRAGPSAILRPLPTFASLTRSVWNSDFIIHSECIVYLFLFLTSKISLVTLISSISRHVIATVIECTINVHCVCT